MMKLLLRIWRARLGTGELLHEAITLVRLSLSAAQERLLGSHSCRLSTLGTSQIGSLRRVASFLKGGEA